MSVFHHNMLIGASGQGAVATSYQISRSLRFNSADSAYLSRTPASAGNRTTWTWSGWVKRAALSATQGGLFGARDSTSSYFQLYYPSGDALRVIWYDTSQKFADTAAVFRDPSAWYHVVLAVDTTQGTAADRIKIYVNNIQQTLSGNTISSSYSTLVSNNGSSHVIGRYAADQDTYLSAYLTDIHFIDGQALTPSSFGEFDTDGIWQPKAYSGTYGTNGFRLDFADNSNNTATTLGKDTSGNGNNWTPTNLSVTAGTGNDSLVDSPTNYGTDTGAGGEVRGNYCTWNVLDKGTSITLSNGNLDYAGGASSNTVRATLRPTAGKWYWEISGADANTIVGLAAPTDSLSVYPGDAGTSGRGYMGNGNYIANGTVVATWASYTTSDVISFAFDVDAGTCGVYKNNVLQGTWTGVSALGPCIGRTGGIGSANFGQRPFAYTAPSGYKALCTANLPAPLITKPSTVMDVALWSGNGTARSITGLTSPDLVWIKCRSDSFRNVWFDSVRGATKRLISDLTNAEDTGGGLGVVSAFNSDGFSLDGGGGSVNESGQSYVAWCWDAGSSTVTNTQGSISSQVRANATAGFSVVGWNYPGGTGASTIGHGLGVKPGMIILKNRDSAANWIIYHSAIGATKCFRFTTAAASTESDPWNDTEPTSTVFSIGAASWHNPGNIIAYCFAPVAGYSSFGSYTGNGSTDGPFVYTGFRPRWVMIKSSTTAGTNWLIVDAARDTYNAVFTDIQANTSNPENQNQPTMDFTSNGFKLRNISSSANGSSATFVYAAFAENPFSIARAR